MRLPVMKFNNQNIFIKALVATGEEKRGRDLPAEKVKSLYELTMWKTHAGLT